MCMDEKSLNEFPIGNECVFGAEGPKVRCSVPLSRHDLVSNGKQMCMDKKSLNEFQIGNKCAFGAV